MAKVAQQWQSNELDAIGIRANQGTFSIEGIDGDQVKLNGEIAARASRNVDVGLAGRWLKIYSSWQWGESKMVLQLPKNKIWTIDIFAGKAQVKAQNIQGAMHIWCGKGEIQVQDYRGNLFVTSGNADVKIIRFTEIETVQVLPLPRDERNFSFADPESWEEWGEDFGNQWSGEFGEKFLKGFFGHTTLPNAGLSIQTGKGDVHLEDFDFKTGSIRTARGDAKLKQGRAGNFDAKIISGDVSCESCLPTGDWTIRSNRGDVHLSLTSDSKARLDLTTRHGDIQSKTPLVRVSRQGPESWHGNRMVGSIGDTGTGKLPEVKLSTLSGDIEIKTEPARSRYSNIPEKEEPMTVNPVTQPSGTYNTELEILTALGEGKINVNEAEFLLTKLKQQQ
jgi:hypothetical protein